VGLLARAVQHELDHLNGVLLVDRMSPVQKAAIAGKLKRLRRSAA
jgi:peptide deformylase